MGSKKLFITRLLTIYRYTKQGVMSPLRVIGPPQDFPKVRQILAAGAHTLASCNLFTGTLVLIDVVQGGCTGELSRHDYLDSKRIFVFTAKEECFYHTTQDKTYFQNCSTLLNNGKGFDKML